DLEQPLESSGSEEDERPGGLGLDREGVRHLTRSPDPAPGAADEVLVTHPEPDRPLEHVERLVLAVVDVQRGAEPAVEARVHEAERAPGVGRARLDPVEAAVPPVRLLVRVERERDAGHRPSYMPIA